ncbi:MAG TPA: hypothetical protein VFG69_08245, partial [Nannocystaceae bacterium]|nr:hypothetical protein [Nannocystaceae bacterium]
HGIFGYGVDPTPIIDDFRSIGGRIAGLLDLLDGIVEPDGTLLDNSIVYWSMQYGCAVPDSQHEPRDMPVLVAGGGGGRLAQGNLVDYRLEGGGPGIALNNLLVTFMNCMGLSSSDYELNAGQGYGYYAGSLDGRPNAAFWASTEGRRSALPVIYQGPALG